MSSQQALHEQIITMLRSIYDPEIPANIHDMGLIYRIEVSDDGVASIDMTLTSPGCPVAESLVAEVKAKVGAVDGISAVNLEIVWEPPWSEEMMSEAAQLELAWC